jgi:hypothetical protein
MAGTILAVLPDAMPRRDESGHAKDAERDGRKGDAMSKPKSLGQIAYEAAFTHNRKPYAHTDYPAAWDRVARAVLKAVRRRNTAAYRSMVDAVTAKGTTP